MRPFPPPFFFTKYVSTKTLLPFFSNRPLEIFYLSKKIYERDVISAGQFNLVANTLNRYHTEFQHNHLPPPDTALPPAWHLGYFPPRIPESELSSDGYETDWSPPAPFIRRMWAGGRLKWNKENMLRVGQDVTMVSKATDVQVKKGGKRGDAVFIWVDKTLENQHGWALTESRSWVYVKDQPPNNSDTRKKEYVLPKPDFSFEFMPTPMTLFRFSALTFNSHLIHYDHLYATTKEHRKG